MVDVGTANIKERSFFNEGKSISKGLPFYFFVDFTIYVIEFDQP
jgi:hypothetical protein